MIIIKKNFKTLNNLEINYVFDRKKFIEMLFFDIKIKIFLGSRLYSILIYNNNLFIFYNNIKYYYFIFMWLKIIENYLIINKEKKISIFSIHKNVYFYLNKNILKIYSGLSFPIKIIIPKNITISIKNQKKINFSSINKNLLEKFKDTIIKSIKINKYCTINEKILIKIN